jgi:hypothetical protein
VREERNPGLTRRGEEMTGKKEEELTDCMVAFVGACIKILPFCIHSFGRRWEKLKKKESERRGETNELI